MLQYTVEVPQLTLRTRFGKLVFTASSEKSWLNKLSRFGVIKQVSITIETDEPFDYTGFTPMTFQEMLEMAGEMETPKKTYMLTEATLSLAEWLDEFYDTKSERSVNQAKRLLQSLELELEKVKDEYSLS